MIIEATELSALLRARMEGPARVAGLGGGGEPQLSLLYALPLLAAAQGGAALIPIQAPRLEALIQGRPSGKIDLRVVLALEEDLGALLERLEANVAALALPDAPWAVVAQVACGPERPLHEVKALADGVRTLCRSRAATMVGVAHDDTLDDAVLCSLVILA